MAIDLRQNISNLAMKMSRVLVLLAARNGAEWISAQVSSIMAQRGVELHLHVVDDASNDPTPDLLKQLSRKYSNISYSLRAEPSGSAGASFRDMFRKVDHDGFDYIALADQDDVWDDEKLQAGISRLRREGADGYSGAVLAHWLDGYEKILAQSTNFSRADFVFEGAGQGCTFILTSRLYRRVKAFCDEHKIAVEKMHYHDWMIYVIASAARMSWCLDARSYTRYRQHHKNEIGAKRGYSGVARRLDLIRSGWYIEQIGAAARVYLEAGGTEVELIQKIKALCAVASTSFWARINLSILQVLYGRRSLRERMALSLLLLLPLRRGSK